MFTFLLFIFIYVYFLVFKFTTLFSSEMLACFCCLDIRNKRRGKLPKTVNLDKKSHTRTNTETKNRQGKRIIDI